jgi:lysozyme family protein
MRIWRWLKSLFRKKVPTSTPSEPVVVDETPAMAEQRAADIFHDNINNGSPANPDWYYIATNIKLDNDTSKLSTIAWYYRRFKEVEGEIRAASKAVNVPWWFIAGIDMREMSFVHTGHFANGDKILGTGRKTYRVPKNLGPADTWMQSVIQVFDYKAKTAKDFTALLSPDMNLGDACAAWEHYNGHGSRSRGEYNSYVVGFTNFHDETGRWVRDHVFDRNAEVKRPGAAAFALYLVKMGDLKRKELGLSDV